MKDVAITVDEIQISMIRAACDSYSMLTTETGGRRWTGDECQANVEVNLYLWKDGTTYYAMVMVFLYMINVKFISDSSVERVCSRHSAQIGAIRHHWRGVSRNSGVWGQRA
jgi:hypothetical protein